MTTCPHCGQTMPEPLIDKLRRYCRENGLAIFPGDRVSEQAAAELVGRSPGTLRNWRAGGGVLPVVRTGAGRGRVSYRLGDIAEMLEREETCT